LTVVLEQPARAAIASMCKVQTPLRLTCRPMTVRTYFGEREVGGDLRRDNAAHEPSTVSGAEAQHARRTMDPASLRRIKAPLAPNGVMNPVKVK
jgi:hypothetical protein